MAIEKLDLDMDEVHKLLDQAREELEREPNKCFCPDCESYYYAKNIGCPFCGSGVGVMFTDEEE